MEHIEEAGIHSGDSACSLPVHTLSPEIVEELKRQTIELAKALHVGGLMNVQYAVKEGVIYILEVNPRASRTVPFVAKTIGRPIAKVAARVMAGEKPLLFDTYLTNAIEVDVDCLCDGEDTFVAGIMEHIEEAGIHSGDSACSLPVHTLSPEIVEELKRQTIELAKALHVGGLMNVQYAVKEGVIYILEVNPRASRTVPFVAKTIGRPIAKIAARIMTGDKLENAVNRYGGYPKVQKKPHIAVKEAVFPFARFQGVDTLLGPEMRSTGEVMGLDYSFALAYAKAQLGAGNDLPREGTLFVSVKDDDKIRVLGAVKRMAKLGFSILATTGTQKFLEEHGVKAKKINKVLEGRPHIEDAIRNRQVQIVFNTTDTASAISDSKSLRRAALMQKVPYYTTMSGAVSVVDAIEALQNGTIEVRSLQEYTE